MLRPAILALRTMATVACSSSRVAVTLEEASIRSVENEEIFSGFIPAERRHVQRQVVEFRISSQTDVIKYFEDRRLQIQVRCHVDGNTNGKAYETIGFGPRIDRMENDRALRNSTNKPGRFYYVVYSFVDLKAYDVEYKEGKPATTLDLEADRFESLRCRIVGVEMGALIFPRSNDFGVSAKEFHELARLSASGR